MGTCSPIHPCVCVHVYTLFILLVYVCVYMCVPHSARLSDADHFLLSWGRVCLFTWKHVAKCSGFVFSHDGGFVCVHTHTDRQAFIHTCVCVCVCVCVVMCITSLAVSWGVIWRYKSVMDWLIDLTSPKFNGCIPSSIPCLLSPPPSPPLIPKSPLLLHFVFSHSHIAYLDVELRHPILITLDTWS